MSPYGPSRHLPPPVLHPRPLLHSRPALSHRPPQHARANPPCATWAKFAKFRAAPNHRPAQHSARSTHENITITGKYAKLSAAHPICRSRPTRPAPSHSRAGPSRRSCTSRPNNRTGAQPRPFAHEIMSAPHRWPIRASALRPRAPPRLACRSAGGHASTPARRPGPRPCATGPAPAPPSPAGRGGGRSSWMGNPGSARPASAPPAAKSRPSTAQACPPRSPRRPLRPAP